MNTLMDAAGRPAGVAAIPDSPAARPLRRMDVAAAVAGNALEFYDFLCYSLFAVYIGKTFFPAGDPLINLLLSLASFGVGFFTRPLGGVLIGAYADRKGRRPAMTLTIYLMGLGTLGLVLTPGYAQLGLLSPVLLVLFRLIQGLALGGEVGPTTALLFEAAQPHRRGLIASWQGASQGLAILASGIVGVLLTLALPAQQLADWGWRLSFALGLVVVPLGLYIRRRLPETLELAAASQQAPVLSRLWQHRRRAVGLAILVILSATVATYVNAYLTTFALSFLHMPASEAVWATVVNGAVMFVGSLASGWLADRHGARVVMIWPRVAMVLCVYPAFWVLRESPSLLMLAAVSAVLTACNSLGNGAIYAGLTALFPSGVRSSGMSIAYAFSVSVFGGSAQAVVTWLIGRTGDALSPAYYVIATGLISLLAITRLPRSRLHVAAEDD